MYLLPQVRNGLNCLSQKILGPNTIIQASVPGILKETPKSFYAETLDFIESNAQLFYSKISAISGLKPVMPQGAMYMMVRSLQFSFIWLTQEHIENCC
mgnify:FL=1